MAEMTAAEALSTLVSLHRVGPYDLSGVIEVIEKQAQEITRINACLQYEQHRTGRQGTHAEGCYKWGPGHWGCAMQEIAKRGRMLDKACELLSNTGCPGLEDVYCAENCNTEMNGSYCWLAWLGKEAEGAGK